MAGGAVPRAPTFHWHLALERAWFSGYIGNIAVVAGLQAETDIALATKVIVAPQFFLHSFTAVSLLHWLDGLNAWSWLIPKPIKKLCTGYQAQHESYAVLRRLDSIKN
jgi:hypothetical protein